MRKGDATRVRILDEAVRQSAVKGLAGVSLNDVAEAVGLSKSGLFKHFDSKEAMQLALVELMLERFTQFVWRPAEGLPRGRARLETLFDAWLDWSDLENSVGGCPLVAWGVELDDQPGAMRDLLKDGQRRWSRTLAGDFKAMRDPPLSDEEARMAVFQMKSFILGHGEARRLLETDGARRITRGAFTSLLDRTEAG